MKRSIFVAIAALTVAVFDLTAQDGMAEVSGRVVDAQGAGVGFATVAMADSVSGRSSGTVADSIGWYKFNVKVGVYTMEVRCVGYKTYNSAQEIKKDTKMEDIVLQADANGVDKVVVTAAPIVREADRFVMNLAGSSTAIGQSAYQILEQAPGVWMSEQNGITINGKSGVKVMIGEQTLTLSKDELNNYLRSMPAENIRKIEIITNSGADYDANSRSGIIKITMERQREAGVDGSVELAAAVDKHGDYNVMPSANVNFRKDKLSLYTNLNYSDMKARQAQEFKAVEDGGTQRYESRSKREVASDRYAGTLGAIYDFNDRHTLMAEFYGARYDNGGKPGEMVTMFPDGTSQSQRGTSEYRSNQVRGTLNYVVKLDSMGSQVKLVGDYTAMNYGNKARQEYYNGDALGYLYRNDDDNRYDLFTVDASAEVKAGEMGRIKGGLKFSSGKTRSETLQEMRLTAADPWETDTERSMILNYRENIAAMYATYSTRVKRFSFILGLRGEYTNVKPTTTTYNQQGTVGGRNEYWSLFPNANLSLALNKKMNHSLVLAYARTIWRPDYYSLNPAIIRQSEQIFSQGNPKLKPSYDHDVSLELILNNRYTISVGTYYVKDEMGQEMADYAAVPGAYLYKTTNVPGGWNYYASVNVPVQATKWLMVNTNLWYNHKREVLVNGGPKEISNSFFGNVSANVTLPKGFFVSTMFWYQPKNKYMNYTFDERYSLTMSVRKRMMGDRVTASISVNNLVGTGRFDMEMQGAGSRMIMRLRGFWHGRQVHASLRYSFKSGAATRIRRVEQANDSRLSSSGKGGGGSSTPGGGGR